MQNKIITIYRRFAQPHPVYFNSGSPKLVSLALEPVIQQLKCIRNQLESRQEMKKRNKEEKKLIFVNKTDNILEKLVKMASFQRQEIEQKGQNCLNDDQVYKMLTPQIAQQIYEKSQNRVYELEKKSEDLSRQQQLCQNLLQQQRALKINLQKEIEMMSKNNTHPQLPQVSELGCQEIVNNI